MQHFKVHSSVGLIFHRIKQRSSLPNYTIFSSPPHQCCRCSVTQLCLTLWPHGRQHARPPCPSPSTRVCPSSCSLHQWCCPAISSSDALFSFCPQSSPASGIFPVSRLSTSNDQNTGTSASASVLPLNIQGWSLLRLTGLISLLSEGLSGVFSSTIVWSHQFFGILPSLWSSSHNSHQYQKLPLGVTPFSLLFPQPLATINQLSVSVHLPILDISC